MPVPRDANPPRLMLDEKAIPESLRKQYKALWDKKYKALKTPKLKKDKKGNMVPVPDKAYDDKHRKLNKDLHLLYEDISKTPR